MLRQRNNPAGFSFAAVHADAGSQVSVIGTLSGFSILSPYIIIKGVIQLNNLLVYYAEDYSADGVLYTKMIDSEGKCSFYIGSSDIINTLIPNIQIYKSLESPLIPYTVMFNPSYEAPEITMVDEEIPLTPAGILNLNGGGPHVWLNAADNASTNSETTPTEILDRSGNGNNATLNNVTIVQQNNLNALRFTREPQSTLFGNYGNITNIIEATVFVVARISGPPTVYTHAGRILSFWNGTYGNDLNFVPLMMNPHWGGRFWSVYNNVPVGGYSSLSACNMELSTVCSIYYCQYMGGYINFGVDGVVTTCHGIATNSLNIARYSIGNSSATYTTTSNESIDGIICEVIIYNYGLTDEEKIRVETYLSSKWNTPKQSSITTITTTRAPPVRVPPPSLTFNGVAPIIWLDPTYGTLSELSDRSGNGNNATLTNVTETTVNGNKAIVFTASSKLKANLSNTINVSTCSVFVVGKINTNSGFQGRILSFGDGGFNNEFDHPGLFIPLLLAGSGNFISYVHDSGDHGNPVGRYVGNNFQSPGEYGIFYCNYSSTTLKNGLNNSIKTNTINTGPLGMNNIRYYSIGCDAHVNNSTSSYIDGTICEVIVYNFSIDDAQKSIITAYLSNKWDITNMDNIITSIPKTISSTQTTFDFSSSTVSLTGGGPLVWLNPADTSSITKTGGVPTGILDRSGNGNNATLTSVTETTINGKNALEFSRTSRLLSSTINSNSLSNFTIFLVYKRIYSDGSIPGGRLLSFWDGFSPNDNNLSSFVPFATDHAHSYAPYYNNSDILVNNGLRLELAGEQAIYYCKYSRGKVYCGKNSVIFNKDLVNSNLNIKRYAIGREASNATSASTPNAYIQGTICELLIFDYEMIDTDRNIVEKYLSSKWGILNVNTPYEELGTFTLTRETKPTLNLSGQTILNKQGPKVWLNPSDPSSFLTATTPGFTFNTFLDLAGYSTIVTMNNIDTTTVNKYSVFDFSITKNSNILGNFTTAIKVPELTTFVVCKLNSNSNGLGRIFSFNDIIPIQFQGDTTNVGTYINGTWSSPLQIPSTSYNILYSQITRNGVTTGVNGEISINKREINLTLNTTSYAIGEIDGLICEVLVFNYAMSDHYRHIIEIYLAVKWGIQSILSSKNPYSQITSIPNNIKFNNITLSYTLPSLVTTTYRTTTTTTTRALHLSILNVLPPILWLNPSETSTINYGTSVITDRSENGNNGTLTNITRTNYNGYNVLQLTPMPRSSITGSFSTPINNFTLFVVCKLNLNISPALTYGRIISFGNHTGLDFNNKTVCIPLLYKGNTNVLSTMYNNTWGPEISMPSSRFGIFYCQYADNTITNGVNGNLNIIDIKMNNLYITSYCIGTNAGPDQKNTNLDGIICEVLLFNYVMKENDRYIVESYLASKWDTESSLSFSNPLSLIPKTSLEFGITDDYIISTHFFSVTPVYPVRYHDTIQKALADMAQNSDVASIATVLIPCTPPTTYYYMCTVPDTNVSNNTWTMKNNMYQYSIVKRTNWKNIDTTKVKVDGVIFPNFWSKYQLISNQVTQNPFFAFVEAPVVQAPVVSIPSPIYAVVGHGIRCTNYDRGNYPDIGNVDVSGCLPGFTTKARMHTPIQIIYVNPSLRYVLDSGNGCVWSLNNIGIGARLDLVTAVNVFRNPNTMDYNRITNTLYVCDTSIPGAWSGYWGSLPTSNRIFAFNPGSTPIILTEGTHGNIGVLPANIGSTPFINRVENIVSYDKKNVIFFRSGESLIHVYQNGKFGIIKSSAEMADMTYFASPVYSLTLDKERGILSFHLHSGTRTINISTAVYDFTGSTTSTVTTSNQVLVRVLPFINYNRPQLNIKIPMYSAVVSNEGVLYYTNIDSSENDIIMSIQPPASNTFDTEMISVNRNIVLPWVDPVRGRRFNYKITGIALFENKYLYMVYGNAICTLVYNESTSTWSYQNITNPDIGSVSNPGFKDGLKSSARLNNPRSIIFVEKAGFLYILDTGNNCIRVFHQYGVTTNQYPNTLTTLHATVNAFKSPMSMSYDSNNCILYVADTGNHVIKSIDPGYPPVIIAGGGLNTGLYGPAVNLQLFLPNCVAFYNKLNILFFLDSTGYIRVYNNGNIGIVCGVGEQINFKETGWTNIVIDTLREVLFCSHGTTIYRFSIPTLAYRMVPTIPPSFLPCMMYGAGIGSNLSYYSGCVEEESGDIYYNVAGGPDGGLLGRTPYGENSATDLIKTHPGDPYGVISRSWKDSTNTLSLQNFKHFVILKNYFTIYILFGHAMHTLVHNKKTSPASWVYDPVNYPDVGVILTEGDSNTPNSPQNTRMKNPRWIIAVSILRTYILDDYGIRVVEGAGCTATVSMLPNTRGVFNNPHSMCYNALTNTIYVADTGNNRIMSFSPGNIPTQLLYVTSPKYIASYDTNNMIFFLDSTGPISVYMNGNLFNVTDWGETRLFSSTAQNDTFFRNACNSLCIDKYRGILVFSTTGQYSPFGKNDLYRCNISTLKLTLRTVAPLNTSSLTVSSLTLPFSCEANNMGNGEVISPYMDKWYVSRESLLPTFSADRVWLNMPNSITNIDISKFLIYLETNQRPKPYGMVCIDLRNLKYMQFGPYRSLNPNDFPGGKVPEGRFAPFYINGWNANAATQTYTLIYLPSLEIDIKLLEDNIPSPPWAYTKPSTQEFLTSMIFEFGNTAFWSRWFPFTITTTSTTTRLPSYSQPSITISQINRAQVPLNITIGVPFNVDSPFQSSFSTTTTVEQISVTPVFINTFTEDSRTSYTLGDIVLYNTKYYMNIAYKAKRAQLNFIYFSIIGLLPTTYTNYWVELTNVTGIPTDGAWTFIPNSYITLLNAIGPFNNITLAKAECIRIPTAIGVGSTLSGWVVYTGDVITDTNYKNGIFKLDRTKLPGYVPTTTALVTTTTTTLAPIAIISQPNSYASVMGLNITGFAIGTNPNRFYICDFNSGNIYCIDNIELGSGSVVVSGTTPTVSVNTESIARIFIDTVELNRLSKIPGGRAYSIAISPVNKRMLVFMTNDYNFSYIIGFNINGEYGELLDGNTDASSMYIIAELPNRKRLITTLNSQDLPVRSSIFFDSAGNLYCLSKNNYLVKVHTNGADSYVLPSKLFFSPADSSMYYIENNTIKTIFDSEHINIPTLTPANDTITAFTINQSASIICYADSNYLYCLFLTDGRVRVSGTTADEINKVPITSRVVRIYISSTTIYYITSNGKIYVLTIPYITVTTTTTLTPQAPNSLARNTSISFKINGTVTQKGIYNFYGHLLNVRQFSNDFNYYIRGGKIYHHVLTNRRDMFDPAFTENYSIEEPEIGSVLYENMSKGYVASQSYPPERGTVEQSITPAQASNFSMLSINSKYENIRTSDTHDMFFITTDIFTVTNNDIYRITIKYRFTNYYSSTSTRYQVIAGNELYGYVAHSITVIDNPCCHSPPPASFNALGINKCCNALDRQGDIFRSEIVYDRIPKPIIGTTVGLWTNSEHIKYNILSPDGSVHNPPIVNIANSFQGYISKANSRAKTLDRNSFDALNTQFPNIPAPNLINFTSSHPDWTILGAIKRATIPTILSSANPTRAYGHAFDSKGNLYICDYGTGYIFQTNPSGIVVEFIGPRVGLSPAAIAVDPRGTLFISYMVTGPTFTTSSTTINTLTTTPILSGIVYSNYNVYANCPSPENDRRNVKIGPITSGSGTVRYVKQLQASTYTTNAPYMIPIALDFDGNLCSIAYEYNSGKILYVLEIRSPDEAKNTVSAADSTGPNVMRKISLPDEPTCGLAVVGSISNENLFVYYTSVGKYVNRIQIFPYVAIDKLIPLSETPTAIAVDITNTYVCIATYTYIFTVLTNIYNPLAPNFGYGVGIIDVTNKVIEGPTYGIAISNNSVYYSTVDVPVVIKYNIPTVYIDPYWNVPNFTLPYIINDMTYPTLPPPRATTTTTTIPPPPKNYLVYNETGPKSWNQYTIRHSSVQPHMIIGQTFQIEDITFTTFYKGNWSSNETYYLGYIVLHNGSNYINLSWPDPIGASHSGSSGTDSNPTVDTFVWKAISLLTPNSSLQYNDTGPWWGQYIIKHALVPRPIIIGETFNVDHIPNITTVDKGIWVSDAYYYLGNVVRHSGSTYINLTWNDINRQSIYHGSYGTAPNIDNFAWMPTETTIRPTSTTSTSTSSTTTTSTTIPPAPNANVVYNVTGPSFGQFTVKKELIPNSVIFGETFLVGDISITPFDSGVWSDGVGYYIGAVVTYNGTKYINLSWPDPRGASHSGSSGMDSRPGVDIYVWKAVTAEIRAATTTVILKPDQLSPLPKGWLYPENDLITFHVINNSFTMSNQNISIIHSGVNNFLALNFSDNSSYLRFSDTTQASISVARTVLVIFIVHKFTGTRVEGAYFNLFTAVDYDNRVFNILHTFNGIDVTYDNSTNSFPSSDTLPRFHLYTVRLLRNSDVTASISTSVDGGYLYTVTKTNIHSNISLASGLTFGHTPLSRANNSSGNSVIGEVIIYREESTTNIDIQSIQTYLLHKWNIPKRQYGGEFVPKIIYEDAEDSPKKKKRTTTETYISKGGGLILSPASYAISETVIPPSS